VASSATPLVYFTDGEDVILTASNYGGARHPGWYDNLIAHPAVLGVGRPAGLECPWSGMG